MNGVQVAGGLAEVTGNAGSRLREGAFRLARERVLELSRDFKRTRKMKYMWIAVAATALAGAARAETWVDTRHATEVDVDSIHTEGDGLTYYMERRKYDDEPVPARAAVDCKKRVSYSSYSIQYEAEWRAKGEKVIPGTMGEVLLDFVCTRVK